MQPFEGKIELMLKCKQCGSITYVTVDKLAYNQWWWSGKGAKELFPELTEHELNMLIDKRCWVCVDNELGLL